METLGRTALGIRTLRSHALAATLLRITVLAGCHSEAPGAPFEYASLEPAEVSRSRVCAPLTAGDAVKSAREQAEVALTAAYANRGPRREDPWVETEGALVEAIPEGGFRVAWMHPRVAGWDFEVRTRVAADGGVVVEIARADYSID